MNLTLFGREIVRNTRINQEIFVTRNCSAIAAPKKGDSVCITYLIYNQSTNIGTIAENPHPLYS